MDIYDRILDIEHRLAALEAMVHEFVNAERPPVATVRTSRPSKTEYMPRITEELVELSKMDKRVEDTRVDRPRSKDTNPRLRAAVSAVSRAVELSKEAQLLVEDVQHLAKALMDEPREKETEKG